MSWLWWPLLTVLSIRRFWAVYPHQNMRQILQPVMDRGSNSCQLPDYQRLCRHLSEICFFQPISLVDLIVLISSIWRERRQSVKICCDLRGSSVSPCCAWSRSWSVRFPGGDSPRPPALDVGMPWDVMDVMDGVLCSMPGGFRHGSCTTYMEVKWRRTSSSPLSCWALLGHTRPIIASTGSYTCANINFLIYSSICHLSIHLSLKLSICPPIHLFTYLFVHPYFHLSIYTSVHLTIHLFFVSVHPPIHVHPSIQSTCHYLSISFFLPPWVYRIKSDQI